MKTRSEAILVMAVFTLCLFSCKREIPDQILGTWQQSGDSNIKLRFEQSGRFAQAFFSTHKDNWFGPLKVDVYKNGYLMITVADVTIENNGKTTIIGVPEYTKNMKNYLSPDGGWRVVNNRILMGSYTSLFRQEVVTANLEKDSLIVEGLWADVTVTEWDDQGHPTGEQIKPVKTGFVRTETKPAK